MLIALILTILASLSLITFLALQRKKLLKQLNEKHSKVSEKDAEKQKVEEKNKKLWQMSEAVYKEKGKVDEENRLLQLEKEKLAAEKKRVDEKVKKLWSQSMAIHKEKERINELKQIIENKHQEIIDSVNYAKRIQEAILPDVREISMHLPNSFILYKPRDIVSGDFYWFTHKDNKTLIASVDCTGHGVPGAFMSMIGNTILNQIVNERGITDPAQILDQLNIEVNYALKQTQADSESRDGMDIAICCLQKLPPSPRGEEACPEPVEGGMRLEYAAAMRPLYLIRNGELIETKANKFPIGGLSYEIEKKFTRHTFELLQGDTVYIFTDGFADQFNHSDKKLMTKKFKETLLSIQDQDMPSQKTYLDEFITNWRGKTDQTDDILVIGIRV